MAVGLLARSRGPSQIAEAGFGLRVKTKRDLGASPFFLLERLKDLRRGSSYHGKLIEWCDGE